jgi:hypothetical protein
VVKVRQLSNSATNPTGVDSLEALSTTPGKVLQNNGRAVVEYAAILLAMHDDNTRRRRLDDVLEDVVGVGWKGIGRRSKSTWVIKAGFLAYLPLCVRRIDVSLQLGGVERSCSRRQLWERRCSCDSVCHSKRTSSVDNGGSFAISRLTGVIVGLSLASQSGKGGKDAAPLSIHIRQPSLWRI